MRKSLQYYQRERERGQRISAIVHVFFLAIIMIGLPDFLIPPPPEEPAAITVELLPITGITNVKPQEKMPAPEPKPEPKPEEKKTEAKPQPPVKTAEAPPPPPPKDSVKPDKKKPEEKKPDPKKEDKKQDDKKTKAKEEDLDAVLKAVKTQAQKQKDKKDKKDAGSQSKSVSNSYDANLPMSMSEKDAIRSQIAKFWNVPAGAKDAHELVIVLEIELAEDGTVLKVELANASKARYSRDTFFRAAADSAIRAVKQCAQIKNLPPEKYQTWRDMELTFDPKEMLF